MSALKHLWQKADNVMSLVSQYKKERVREWREEKHPNMKASAKWHMLKTEMEDK